MDALVWFAPSSLICSLFLFLFALYIVTLLKNHEMNVMVNVSVLHSSMAGRCGLFLLTFIFPSLLFLSVFLLYCIQTYILFVKFRIAPEILVIRECLCMAL